MSTTGPAGALLNQNFPKGNGASAPADRSRESAGQRLAWTREMERVQLNTWFKAQLPGATVVTPRPQNSGQLKGTSGTAVKGFSAPASMQPVVGTGLDIKSDSARVEPAPLGSAFGRQRGTQALSRPQAQGSAPEAKADDEGLAGASGSASTSATLTIQMTQLVEDASRSSEMPMGQARLDSMAPVMSSVYRPASTPVAAWPVQATAALAPLQAEQMLMALPQHARSGDFVGATQSVPRAGWALARASAGQPARPSVQSGAPVAPVRLHEESTLKGQAVWIAVRADDVQLLSMMPQWIADLERGMRSRGDRLHQVVCNGRLVWRDGTWHSDAPVNAASPADSGIPFNANPSQEN